MITGSVTPEGIPVVTLTLAGESWTAIIDTGFNGDLELPGRLQPFVNARFLCRNRSLLAAGQIIEEDSYLEISELRISSIRSAMSLAPLCPVPAARSCRGVAVLKYASRASLVTTAMGTPLSSASWRRMASRVSGSFTVVRFTVCQHTSTPDFVEGPCSW